MNLIGSLALPGPVGVFFIFKYQCLILRPSKRERLSTLVIPDALPMSLGGGKTLEDLATWYIRNLGSQRQGLRLYQNSMIQRGLGSNRTADIERKVEPYPIQCGNMVNSH